MPAGCQFTPNRTKSNRLSRANTSSVQSQHLRWLNRSQKETPAAVTLCGGHSASRQLASAQTLDPTIRKNTAPRPRWQAGNGSLGKLPVKSQDLPGEETQRGSPRTRRSVPFCLCVIGLYIKKYINIYLCIIFPSTSLEPRSSSQAVWRWKVNGNRRNVETSCSSSPVKLFIYRIHHSCKSCRPSGVPA